MNKYVLLVMEWLADASSVSQEDLEKNRHEAWAAYDAAADAYAVADTEANLIDAYNAADAATAHAAYGAAYWVNKYFEITGEDRAQYEKELEK